MQKKEGGGGGQGLLRGDTLVAHDAMPTAAGGTGTRAVTSTREEDRRKFTDLARALKVRMEASTGLKRLPQNVRFTETREGLRIDIVHEANISMFDIATDRLSPSARAPVDEVAHVAADVPNDLIVRGHTDSVPYAATAPMNNWLLSTARAEATRQALAMSGVAVDRFARIEGVADREPLRRAIRSIPRTAACRSPWPGCDDVNRFP